MAIVLRNAGYSVVEAIDGSKGLEVFEATSADIDLIVSDVVMPGMNGAELMEAVRKVDSNVRFLFMSGYKGDPGMDVIQDIPFVQKPFTPSELLDAVQQQLL